MLLLVPDWIGAPSFAASRRASESEVKYRVSSPIKRLIDAFSRGRERERKEKLDDGFPKKIDPFFSPAPPFGGGAIQQSRGEPS